MEYIGEKLSLYVYLFHILIYSLMLVICNRLLNIDVCVGTSGCFFPLLIVFLSVIFADCISRLVFFSNLNIQKHMKGCFENRD